jgi:hypothetical protein
MGVYPSMEVRVLALGLSGPKVTPSPGVATALLVLVLIAIGALAVLLVTDLVMVVARRPVAEPRLRFVRWPYRRRNALVATAAVPALLLVAATRLVTGSSLWTAVIAILLALLLAQVARLAGQAPYGRSTRLPHRLRGRPRPDQGLQRRSYLGWSRGRFGDDEWGLGAEEDTVAIVGPAGSHKTAGFVVPNVAAHRGPVVAASVKRDLLQATVRHRRAVGETSGGPLYGVASRVHVYEPAAAEPIDGVPPMRWSPLDGCENLAVARARAAVAVATADGTPGVEHDGSWRERATRMLAPYLLAGALYPDAERRGDISLVTEWLMQGPSAMGTVAELLEKSIGSDDGRQAAAGLRAESGTPERELGSVFSFSVNALGAAAYDPVVRDNSARTEFSIDEFLLTSSTLYILCSDGELQATAPFVAMLLDALTARAAQLHAEGRLPHPLLLALDGMDAVAPPPSLPGVVAEGSAGGVRTVWTARSREALRAGCGEERAAAIWDGTRARGPGGLAVRARAAGAAVAAGAGHRGCGAGGAGAG